MSLTDPQVQVFICADFDKKGTPQKFDNFRDYAAENKGDAYFVDARANVDAEKVSVWTYQPWRVGMEQKEGEPLGQRIVVREVRTDENREKIEEKQYIEERKKYWKEQRDKEDREDAEDEEAAEDDEEL